MRDWGWSLVIEHFLSITDALNSVYNSTQKKKGFRWVVMVHITQCLGGRGRYL